MRDWTTVLRECPEDLVLGHEIGLPHDPSSVYGREQVRVGMDGLVRLRWWQGERAGEIEAEIDTGLVRQWAALLAEVGFPALPAAPPTRGASYRVLEAEGAGLSTRILVPRVPLEFTPPFVELFGLADALAALLRGRPVFAKPDPTVGKVQAIRPRV